MNTVNKQNIMERDEKLEREWAKMLAGEIYEAGYGGFREMLVATRRKIAAFNSTDPADEKGLAAQLRDILGTCGDMAATYTLVIISLPTSISQSSTRLP